MVSSDHCMNAALRPSYCMNVVPDHRMNVEMSATFTYNHSISPFWIILRCPQMCSVNIFEKSNIDFEPYFTNSGALGFHSRLEAVANPPLCKCPWENLHSVYFPSLFIKSFLTVNKPYFLNCSVSC